MKSKRLSVRRSMAEQGLPLGLVSGAGWRSAMLRWLIALVLGALSVAGLSPLALWPVFFVTLTGLVLLLDAAAGTARVGDARSWPLRCRAAAAVGWWFGFGYFLAGLYWIGLAFLVEAEKFAWLMPFAVTVLPAGLALFFALGAAAARLAWTPGLGRVLALAAALGVTEWLRGNVLTGFPWNALGYALTGNDYIMQVASLVGVTGLSFLAVLVFALPAAALGQDGLWCQLRVTVGAIGASVILLGAFHAFGAWRLSSDEPAPQGSGRLRLVQPNIPQAEKWVGDNRQRIFETYLDLSRRDPHGQMSGFNGVTHVVWPESSLPFLMLQTPSALRAIGDLLPDDVVLITGSLRAKTAADGSLVETDGLYTIYNDIAVLDGTGRPVATFDKMHLVPFGEYLPAQQALESIGLEQLTRLKGGFAAGIGPRALTVPGLPPVIPLVCYEAIFPEEIRPTADESWLLNLTNDAWFGMSSGPYQHLQQARLRAVEQGLPVVRVANTGISAVISARGRVLERLPLGAAGVIESALPGRLPTTIYGRVGDLGLLTLCLCAIAGMRRALIRDRQVTRTR
ncbi:MAG: apolipoprotein N-acyltransferase [Hyphomicrobiaceae bacterium]